MFTCYRRTLNDANACIYTCTIMIVPADIDDDGTDSYSTYIEIVIIYTWLSTLVAV